MPINFLIGAEGKVNRPTPAVGKQKKEITHSRRRPLIRIPVRGIPPVLA
jgi:hypothetical protein